MNNVHGADYMCPTAYRPLNQLFSKKYIYVQYECCILSRSCRAAAISHCFLIVFKDLNRIFFFFFTCAYGTNYKKPQHFASGAQKYVICFHFWKHKNVCQFLICCLFLGVFACKFLRILCGKFDQRSRVPRRISSSGPAILCSLFF